MTHHLAECALSDENVDVEFSLEDEDHQSLTHLPDENVDDEFSLDDGNKRTRDEAFPEEQVKEIRDTATSLDDQLDVTENRDSVLSQRFTSIAACAVWVRQIGRMVQQSVSIRAIVSRSHFPVGLCKMHGTTRWCCFSVPPTPHLTASSGGSTSSRHTYPSLERSRG